MARKAGQIIARGQSTWLVRVYPMPRCSSVDSRSGYSGWLIQALWRVLAYLPELVADGSAFRQYAFLMFVPRIARLHLFD
jgi:hypothetical protein